MCPVRDELDVISTAAGVGELSPVFTTFRSKRLLSVSAHEMANDFLFSCGVITPTSVFFGTKWKKCHI